MKKAKFIFSLVLLLILYIFIESYFYVNQACYDLKDSVFRLHVIANSNSEADQNLKYIVRDNLIEYMNTICSSSSSKEETISIVKQHLSDFTEIANSTIKENGFSYTATVEIGNFEFPTKQYGDISLPAGYYDALKVILGNAQGQNWWCVLYPSLCFVDISSGIVPEESKSELKKQLNNEEYELISNHKNLSINFKFKLIELFAKNGLLSAQKSS